MGMSPLSLSPPRSPPRRPRSPTPTPRLHSTLLTLTFLVLIYFSAQVVGYAGALFLFLLQSLSLFLLFIHHTHPSSRTWHPYLRLVPVALGALGLGYTTYAVFACIVSEIMLSPEARAVAQAFGFWKAAIVALAVAVGAVAGVGWLMTLAWPMVAPWCARALGEEEGRWDEKMGASELHTLVARC